MKYKDDEAQVQEYVRGRHPASGEELLSESVRPRRTAVDEDYFPNTTSWNPHEGRKRQLHLRISVEPPVQNPVDLNRTVDSGLGETFLHLTRTTQKPLHRHALDRQMNYIGTTTRQSADVNIYASSLYTSIMLTGTIRDPSRASPTSDTILLMVSKKAQSELLGDSGAVLSIFGFHQLT